MSIREVRQTVHFSTADGILFCMTKRSQQVRALFVGGLLPVLAFTLIEEHFGTLWGLISGMGFGLGEVLWEWRSQGKVDPLTWGGNGMLLVLGGVSLLTQEGIWFKLQPALIEVVTALVLWGSVLLGKPLIQTLLQKQGALPFDLQTGLKPGVGPLFKQFFQGMTLRMGFFFAIHAALAVWVALYGSTAAWAILKGIGFTVSFIVYLVVESLVLRYRISSIP